MSVATEHMYRDHHEGRGRMGYSILGDARGAFLRGHIGTNKRVIDKAARVLRDDGILVGSVPNAFSLINRFRLFFGRKRLTPLYDPTHVNHFSRAEFSGLLALHFREVTIEPLGRFARLDALWKGMFAFDLLFVAKYPKRP